MKLVVLLYILGSSINTFFAGMVSTKIFFASEENTEAYSEYFNDS